MDFYCASAKLCVELDGSQHYTLEGQKYDLERTAYLNGNGIHVLRFSNADVMRNFSGVCQVINMTVTERIK